MRKWGVLIRRRCQLTQSWLGTPECFLHGFCAVSPRPGFCWWTGLGHRRINNREQRPCNPHAEPAQFWNLTHLSKPQQIKLAVYKSESTTNCTKQILYLFWIIPRNQSPENKDTRFPKDRQEGGKQNQRTHQKPQGSVHPTCTPDTAQG